MKDLRIIIVSWNNRDELPRCLSSLSAACEGMTYDVRVIDNASTDGTKNILATSCYENVEVVLNRENRGFAAACNQGLTGLDARYVLLLNPDTECPPRSLAELVQEAEKHADGAIFGPKLIDQNGMVQPSVRRFPDIWSQLSVFFKLPHLGIRTAWYRRYMAEDINPDAEQKVDQVMGACFLIKSDFMYEVGGLDERYFIWFEEVDYCKQAVARGKSIWYLPSVEVRHIGGSSFSRTGIVRKQQYIAKSMRSYFQKWHPGWQAFVASLFTGLTIAVAVFLDSDTDVSDPRAKTSDTFWNFFLGICAIELLSYGTIFSPIGSTLFAITIPVLIAWTAWKRPSLALSLLFAELVIGSKGALFQLGGWPGTSVRILMFIAFFLGWMGNVMKKKRIKEIWKLVFARPEWLVITVFVSYGVIRGYVLHQPFLFADANAWGFLALILPVLDLADRDARRLRAYAIGACLAGVAWLAILSLGVEYIFSHGFRHFSPPLYLWFRRAGIGEATLIAANGYRIFIQSFIFAIPALLFSVSSSLFGKVSNASRRMLDVLGTASIICLAISLSRSMWMGLAAGFFVILFFIWRELKQLKRDSVSAFLQNIRQTVGKFILLGMVGIAAIFVVISFPIPYVNVASLKDLFGSRISTGDPAAMSRWKLFRVIESKIQEHPVLGSGFGATVTYQSSDPRILAEQKGGLFTTYAFEWGWLEHWVKMGVFGMLAIAWLLYGVLQRAWKSHVAVWLRYGAVATLVALAVTHVFTPYLNHPLGFAIVMAVEGMILVNNNIHSPKTA